MRRSSSPLSVTAAPLESLLHLREQYRAGVGAQIVHDSWHQRGRTVLYRIEEDGEELGYAALGGYPGEPLETFKEFFLVARAVARREEILRAALQATRPRWLEAQTNDPFLAPLIDRFAPDHRAHTYLFAAGGSTALGCAARLRRVAPEDHAAVFRHTTEPVGDWGLELDGALVATGGLFFHYNPPFADVYMEVAPAHRRQGYASYLVQELKRICSESGQVPAARCGIDNPGSRGALERAGMVLSGSIVRGAVVLS